MTAVCINGSCHQKDGDLVCIYTLVQQKICFHADVRCGVKMCPGTIREQRQRDLSFLISTSHSTETLFSLLKIAMEVIHFYYLNTCTMQYQAKILCFPVCELRV